MCSYGIVVLPQLKLIHNHVPSMAYYVSVVLVPREKNLDEGFSGNCGGSKEEGERTEKEDVLVLFLIPAQFRYEGPMVRNNGTGWAKSPTIRNDAGSHCSIGSLRFKASQVIIPAVPTLPPLLAS